MRYLVSVVAGLSVALLLFLLMHFLISGDKGIDKTANQGAVVDFIRVKEDEMTRLKERIPPRKPPPPKDPPPPPKLKIADTSKPPPVRLDIATPRVNVPISTGDGPYIGQWSPGDPAAEGDVIPITMIQPQYPREAMLDGIEGYVVFEITILKDGSVANPKIMESQPRRMFDRSATRAILRWKFKPRIINGEAVKRQATIRLDFNLDQAN
jgi:protein TonB